MSTSPLSWKGPEDRRIRLKLLSVEDAAGQAQSDNLAVFLALQPSTAQQAGWGAVRTWVLQGDGADHGSGCVCCQGGSQLGRFLAGLMQERARGRMCFFSDPLPDLSCTGYGGFDAGVAV
nr:hypothetical protein [Acetobacter malorum]